MPFTFKNREKAVAIFILTGFFLFGVLGVLIAKGSDLITFKKHYYTVFTDAHGFTGGTYVKYKGFNVGRIQSMTLTSDDKIKAKLYIYDKHTRLMTSNTVLKVQSSLLGTSSLTLMYTDSGGKILLPNSVVYSSDMEGGQEILTQHHIAAQATDELTDKVKLILDDVHNLQPMLQSTLTNLSLSMSNLNQMLAGLNGKSVTPMGTTVLASLQHVQNITANIEMLTKRAKSPDNSVGYLLNDNKELITKINHILSDIEKSSNDLKTFTSSTIGNKEEMDKTMKLIQINLVELRNLMKGLQSVVGSGK